MAILNKVVSGIMHQEDFEGYNLLWELSPNDFNRINFNIGKLELKHGDQRISMSIPTPKEDYVFQANIEHSPTTLSDVGGIIINSTTDNQIECQTYFNSGSGANQYFKYIKVCVTGDIYNFLASTDGLEWRNVGNTELLDANRIGFFLDGIVTTLSKDFIVQDATIYKSNIVTINNVPYAATVKVMDSTGKDLLINKNYLVQQYNNKVYLDMSAFKFPLKNITLKVLDPIGNVYTEHVNIDICGGDIYECVENVEIKFNDVVLNSDQIIELGRLSTSVNYYSLLLTNKDTSTLTGKMLKVIPYSDYYRGMDTATVGIKDTVNETVFMKELPLPDVLGGSSLDILVKVEKDFRNVGPFIANKYRFKIILE